MHPSTLERALFDWPEWSDAIARSRARLDYDPMPAGEQLAQWQWEHDGEVHEVGHAELRSLGLPEGLVYYWLACFYSDHTRPDGGVDYDAIRDVFFVPKGEFGDKLYPQAWTLTCPSVRTPRGQTLRGTPFSLEGTLELMRGEIFDEALRALRQEIRQQTKDHPLSTLVNRAKVKPQEKKRNAVSRFRSGEADFSALLREEWLSGDVQAQLQQIALLTSYEAKREAQILQRRVFNRVARWLHTEGIKPPRLDKKGGWARPE